MKKLLLVSMAVALTGCGLTAGKSDYTVQPIVLDDGRVICCAVDVHNSKDYENFKATIEKTADGSIKVILDEQGVNASTPAAVSAQNNSKLIDALTSAVGKL